MIPKWPDLRAVVALKTFYIALVLVLSSLALFGIWIGFEDKSSALAQAVLALAIALATSSTLFARIRAGVTARHRPHASGTLRVIGISANDILAVQPLDVIARRVQAGDLRSTATNIDQFDARYLDRSPMISGIIDESRAIVTPLVVNLTGGRSPYFVVSADGPQGYLYRIYRSHFEELWAHGSSFL